MYVQVSGPDQVITYSENILGDPKGRKLGEKLMMEFRWKGVEVAVAGARALAANLSIFLGSTQILKNIPFCVEDRIKREYRTVGFQCRSWPRDGDGEKFSAEIWRGSVWYIWGQ